MNTTRLEYWRTHQAHINEDQHPGCHTHASGFDYVAWYHDIDKAIDASWERERRQARSVLIEVLIRRAVSVISNST